MLMRLSLPSFVRHCGTGPIFTYLEEIGHGIEEPDDEMSGSVVVNWIEGLGGDARDRIYTDFDAVQQLVGELGQRCLRAASSRDRLLLDSLADDDSNEARGLRALVAAPDEFRMALATHQAERWRHGRNFSCYLVGAGLEARRVNDLPEGLRRALREIFAKAHGTTRGIVVEQFDREQLDGSGRVHQATIYTKGNPSTLSTFEGEVVVPRVIYPAIEAAVTYEPETGRLDVFSGGGEPARKAVAEAFATHMLGHAGEPEKVVLREYDLSCLKKPMRFPTDPEDDIDGVDVTLLRLAGVNDNQARVTIEVMRGSSDTIWQTSRQVFAGNDPLADTSTRVSKADIKVRFR